MSKIIKMTPEYIAECRREFNEALKNAVVECQKNFDDALHEEKLADGKISFTKTFSIDKKRTATVYFTSEAWTKMVVLIQEFSKEVAWHGLASRIESEDHDEYMVYDILVYPQEVTGATVNTDQEGYEKWLMSNDDDVFNNIRMQGHSHVNMGPTPSAVDITHQEKILEQLEDDMFYIFMIWNKSFKRNIKIYDLQKNVLFEDSDVEVKIFDSGIGLDEFINNAKEMVKDKVYSYGSNYGSNYYNGQNKPWTPPGAASDAKPYNPLPASTQKADSKSEKDEKKDKKNGKKNKDKPKVQIGSGWNRANASDDDDPAEKATQRSLFGNYDGYDDDDDLYGPFASYGR